MKESRATLRVIKTYTKAKLLSNTFNCGKNKGDLTSLDLPKTSICNAENLKQSREALHLPKTAKSGKSGKSGNSGAPA